MADINIKNNGIYRIIVNEKGEYVEFDVDDIGLRVRCYEAIEKVEKLQNETQKKIENLMNSDEKDKEKQATFIENDMFKELRKIIDDFMGENACQKIFGNKNYYSMFNDLFRELSKKRKELNGKSHLDMMGIQAKTINEAIMKKYQKGKEDVI